MTNFEIVAAKSKNREQRARALFFTGKINSIYLDQQEKALHIFKKILKSYPESSAAPDAFFESGIIFFDRKNYEKAHSVFTQFGKTYPGNPRQKSAELYGRIYQKSCIKIKEKKVKSTEIKIEKKE